MLSQALKVGYKVFLKPLPELAEKALKILPVVSNPNLGFEFLCFQPLLDLVVRNVMHLDESLEKAPDREQIAPLVRGKHAPEITIKQQDRGLIDRHEITDQAVRKNLVLLIHAQVQFGENAT